MNLIGHTFGSPLQMPLTERLQAAPPQTTNGNNSFADMLVSGVSQVNDMQHGADAQVHELLTGGDVSQVEVLTSVQKADMAFRLLVQVRNKLMAAYDEINAIRI